jgi:hypothetical protein
MPVVAPLTAAAGERLRPRPIPEKVRHALRAMVYGKPGDEDHAPLDFVAAAKLVGMDPPVLRRYFDRGEVRALLLAERRAFRDMICAGNERALQRVRDGENPMAAVRAVQALEGLDEAHAERHGRASNQITPGITIRIVSEKPAAAIDVTPTFIPVPTPSTLLSKPVPAPERPADPIFIDPTRPPPRRMTRSDSDFGH